MARQVLAIQLPVNRTALDKMIMQIKDGLFNLTDIEDIINRTSQHIDKAKELLEKARDAKYVAGRRHRISHKPSGAAFYLPYCVNKAQLSFDASSNCPQYVINIVTLSEI